MPGETNGLVDTVVTDIIPVDLNAFLARSASIISNFYEAEGFTEIAKHWKQRETDLINAMEILLWDEEDGIWYDIDSYGPRFENFSASNLVPLWTRSFPENEAESRGLSCLKYLKKTMKVIHMRIGNDKNQI